MFPRQLATGVSDNQPSHTAARLLVQLMQVLPHLPPAPYDDSSVASWLSLLFPWSISYQADLVVPPVQELATAVQVRIPSILLSAIERRCAIGCLTIVVAVIAGRRVWCCAAFVSAYLSVFRPAFLHKPFPRL